MKKKNPENLNANLMYRPKKSKKYLIIYFHIMFKYISYFFNSRPITSLKSIKNGRLFQLQKP